MALKTIQRIGETSWTTVIDRKLRVALPPSATPFFVGRRVFWRFPKRRGEAIEISLIPKGGLRMGRLLSTRIQRIRLRRPAARLRARYP